MIALHYCYLWEGRLSVSRSRLRERYYSWSWGGGWLRIRYFSLCGSKRQPVSGSVSQSRSHIV